MRRFRSFVRKPELHKNTVSFAKVGNKLIEVESYDITECKSSLFSKIIKFKDNSYAFKDNETDKYVCCTGTELQSRDWISLWEKFSVTVVNKKDANNYTISYTSHFNVVREIDINVPDNYFDN
jgi:hypothetical protein